MVKPHGFRPLGRSAAAGSTGRVEETFIVSRVLLGFGEQEKRGGKDIVMNNSPDITKNGIVPVLSISPMEEDHFFLQDILESLQVTLDPGRRFTVNPCATLAYALAALRKRQFEVVVCEQDLPPGSWKDV